ncbi:MAG: N-acetyltransferase family protein [Candidatus Velthaea sp.]
MIGTLTQRATAADALQMTELLSRVAAEGQWIATEIPFDVEGRARQLGHALAAQTVVGFVVRDDQGIPAGSLIARVAANRAALGMIVAAEHRRQGIGRALMDAVICWGKTAGIEALTLEVFPHNAGALAFYERSGFTQTARRVAAVQRNNGERWDTLAMERRLDRERF